MTAHPLRSRALAGTVSALSRAVQPASRSRELRNIRAEIELTGHGKAHFEGGGYIMLLDGSMVFMYLVYVGERQHRLKVRTIGPSRQYRLTT